MAKNTLATFFPEEFYHIYNRTNNKEPLFLEFENKRYFLRLIEKKLIPFLNIYSYALLTNHFHLSVSIKSENDLFNFLSTKPSESLTNTQKQYLNKAVDVDTLITYQFSGLFNGYSQAFNKRYNRNGNLFYRPFKRSMLKSLEKFYYNQYYIHHNSRKHGLVSSFLDDPWHSFHTLISEEPTFLAREKVFEIFGSKQKFIDFHSKQYDSMNFYDIILEDE